MKIFRVNFNDGVYLNGQVAQCVGLADAGDGEAPPMTLMGLKRVSAINPTAAGVVIVQGDRHFFVPWTSISSCEIAKPEPTLDPGLRGGSIKGKPASTAPGASDLL